VWCGHEQEPDVEVAVPTRARVDIDVEQVRTTGGMPGGQSGLLERLTHGGCRDLFTRIDMAPGLEPDPEALVTVQDHLTGAI